MRCQGLVYILVFSSSHVVRNTHMKMPYSEKGIPSLDAVSNGRYQGKDAALDGKKEGMSATFGHLVRNMYMRCPLYVIYSEQGRKRHNKSPGGVSPKAADNWSLPFTCVGTPANRATGRGNAGIKRVKGPGKVQGSSRCGRKGEAGSRAGQAGGQRQGEKGRERRSGHDLRRPRHSQRVPTSHIIIGQHHQRQGGPAHHHPPSRLALPLPTTAWPPDLVPIGGGTRPNSSKGYDYGVSD